MSAVDDPLPWPVRRVLDRLDETDWLPIYRSPSWHELPGCDGCGCRRCLSMRRAAGCWWADGQHEQVVARLHEADREVLARIRAMSYDLSAAMKGQR